MNSKFLLLFKLQTGEKDETESEYKIRWKWFNWKPNVTKWQNVYFSCV